MLEDFLARTRCTEALHADEDAIRADEAIPAHADAGLDGDADFLGSEDLLAIRLALLVEKLDARHRYDACGRAVLVEHGLGIEGDLDFRARREDHRLRLPVARRDLIGALGTEVLLRVSLARGPELLAGQSEDARRFRRLEFQRPAFRRLYRIAGAVDIAIVNGAQGP